MKELRQLKEQEELKDIAVISKIDDTNNNENITEDITEEERWSVINEWTMRKAKKRDTSDDKQMTTTENDGNKQEKMNEEDNQEEEGKEEGKEEEKDINAALAAEVAMLEELVAAAEAAATEKGQLLSYSKTLEQHIDQLEVLAIA